MVKLQRGRAVLLSEPGPNPANENSAVAVDFQVPRRAAVTVPLVHVGSKMCSRSAPVRVCA